MLTFTITYTDRGNFIQLETKELDEMISVSHMLDYQKRDHQIKMYGDFQGTVIEKELDYKY